MEYAPKDDSRVIYHEGVAEEVNETEAVVRFMQGGACGACKLKSVCNPGEQRVRQVTAWHDGSLRRGDRVRVAVEESVAWLSILFSFVLPFLVIATTFFSVYAYSNSDIVAGVSALAILPFYYLIIYLNRTKLGGKVRFTALPEVGTDKIGLRGIS